MNIYAKLSCFTFFCKDFSGLPYHVYSESETLGNQYRNRDLTKLLANYYAIICCLSVIEAVECLYLDLLDIIFPIKLWDFSFNYYSVITRPVLEGKFLCSFPLKMGESMKTLALLYA